MLIFPHAPHAIGNDFYPHAYDSGSRSTSSLSYLFFIAFSFRVLLHEVACLKFCSYRREEDHDDLSELQSESVPDEVRKWLASTFAKQVSTGFLKGIIS